MNRNRCLNLLKCIACIGVVFIHVKFPGDFGIIISNISKFAVPLFFMIAGYYSAESDIEKLKKRLFKILKILVIGYILFLICNIIIHYTIGDLSSWIHVNYNARNPIMFFVFCNVRFAAPLWYLIAMSETYIFWIIVKKYNWEQFFEKYIYILFFLATILAIIVDTLYLIWQYQINFALRSLTWFVLGILIKKDKHNIVEKISNKKLIIFVFTGWIITLSSVFLNFRIDYNFIGVLITSPSIFMLGVKNPNIKTYNFIDFIGDKLSLFIYILHYPVSKMLLFALKDTDFITNDVYLVFHPLITLIITLALSVLFYNLFVIKKLKKI